MSWEHSKKFRWQAKWMNRHLTRVEAKLRDRVEAQVKIYTPEELSTYAAERGLKISPSLLSQARTRGEEEKRDSRDESRDGGRDKSRDERTGT